MVWLCYEDERWQHNFLMDSQLHHDAYNGGNPWLSLMEKITLYFKAVSIPLKSLEATTIDHLEWMSNWHQGIKIFKNNVTSVILKVIWKIKKYISFLSDIISYTYCGMVFRFPAGLNSKRYKCKNWISMLNCWTLRCWNQDSIIYRLHGQMFRMLAFQRWIRFESHYESISQGGYFLIISTW